MALIEDGGGRGTKAQVNNEGYLKTIAVAETRFEHISAEQHRAYEFHPPRMAIPASEYATMYLANISSTRNFHIQRIRLWWNGGDTSKNTCLIARFYVSPDTPTANAVTGKYGAGNIPHNMFIGSGLNPEVDIQYWDGVGSGMTVASKGEQLWCSLAAQGYSPVEFDGALIIPPGYSCLITMEGEEAGHAIQVISGYFLDPEQGV